MPVYDGGIRAYIGFLVDTVKARGGTTSRGTRRGAVIRCLPLRRQVVTTARRRRGRSRSSANRRRTEKETERKVYYKTIINRGNDDYDSENSWISNGLGSPAAAEAERKISRPRARTSLSREFALKSHFPGSFRRLMRDCPELFCDRVPTRKYAGGRRKSKILISMVSTESFGPGRAFHLPTRGPRVGARGGISISRVGSRHQRRKGRKGMEGLELESGVRLQGPGVSSLAPALRNGITRGVLSLTCPRTPALCHTASPSDLLLPLPTLALQ